MKNSKKKFNVYEAITGKITEGLKTKGLQWFCPWKKNKCTHAYNHESERAYTGWNQLFLTWCTIDNGYTSNEWVAYEQATRLGGNVKKGQKGTQVWFYSVSFKEKSDKRRWFKNQTALKSAGYSSSDIKKILSGKHHKVYAIFTPWLTSVWNLDQCEGLTPKKLNQNDIKQCDFIPMTSADDFIKGYDDVCKKSDRGGLTITHKEQRAYYNPTTDKINMPKQDTFKDSDSYYKTLFHECTHHAGGPKGLNDENITSGSFGNESYSKEEAVAELGSLFLCAELGLEPKDSEENSQAYINGWVKKISNAPEWILSASKKANQRIDYMRFGKK